MLARLRAFMPLPPVFRVEYELNPHLDERFPEDSTLAGEVAPALASPTLDRNRAALEPPRGKFLHQKGLKLLSAFSS